MSATFVDFHVIQTVPPSNMNRDDTGSPKSAVYGGVRRARVSSQAWKRAARVDFERTLDSADLGIRTKRLVEILVEEIGRQAPGTDQAAGIQVIHEIFKAIGIKLTPPRRAKEGALDETGYLLFLSHLQVQALARAAVEALASREPIDKKQVQALVKGQNSIDLALFGRMVAEVTDLNVDAAAQVAHAISVHAVETEFDYFTAVDDHKRDDVDEDAGAGMIGTVEFNSSTLYRYATVNVTDLATNLGDPVATRRAVEAFARSFVRSLPTGKQNTFANRTLPDAVVVVVRDDQPVNWVGAFEAPVMAAGDGGRVREAAQALAAYAADVQDAYGGRPVATWVVGVGSRADALDTLGERTSFEALVPALGDLVASRLPVAP
jgi:CRISPR system Cascade subunit CasC